MPARPITVTTYSGFKVAERPVSFLVEGITIEIRVIEKKWIEEDRDTRRLRRYFTVTGIDENVYTLFFDEDEQEWFLRSP